MCASPHILACTDLHPGSAPGLELAAWLGRALDARVTLLHVADANDIVMLGDEARGGIDLYERVRAAAEPELARLGEDLFAGVPHAAVVARGRGAGSDAGIAATICDEADMRGATTLVLGTHGHEGLRMFLPGSVSEKVLRIAPCEAVTVRSRTGGPWRAGEGRILCAVDFSPASAVALDRAHELAARLGATLHVLHAWEVRTRLVDDPRAQPEAIVERRRAALSAAIADLGDAVPIETHFVRGEGASEILRHAGELDAGLVVIGNLGRSNLARFMIGTVAERVVRASERPVLVVRAPPDAA